MKNDFPQAPEPQVFTLPPRLSVRLGYVFMSLLVTFFFIAMPAEMLLDGGPWWILVPPLIMLYAILSALTPVRVKYTARQEVEMCFWWLEHLIKCRHLGKPKAIILLTRENNRFLILCLAQGKRQILADDDFYGSADVESLAHWLSQNTGARLFRVQRRFA